MTEEEYYTERITVCFDGRHSQDKIQEAYLKNSNKFSRKFQVKYMGYNERGIVFEFSSMYMYDFYIAGQVSLEIMKKNDD